MSAIQTMVPPMMGVAASITAVGNTMAANAVAASGMSVQHGMTAAATRSISTAQQLVWSPSNALGKASVPAMYPQHLANVSASMEPVTHDSGRDTALTGMNVIAGMAVLGLGCVLLYAASRMFKAATKETEPKSTAGEEVPPVVRDTERGAARVRTSGIGTWAQGIRSGNTLPPPKDGDTGPRGIS